MLAGAARSLTAGWGVGWGRAGPGWRGLLVHLPVQTRLRPSFRSAARVRRARRERGLALLPLLGFPGVAGRMPPACVNTSPSCFPLINAAELANGSRA